MTKTRDKSAFHAAMAYAQVYGGKDRSSLTKEERAKLNAEYKALLRELRGEEEPSQ